MSEYDTIFPVKTNVFPGKSIKVEDCHERRENKVLCNQRKSGSRGSLKVIEAKRLMDMQELTVQQATEKAGISRSSFYKYKDDILPFHDNAKEKRLHLFCRWTMSRDCFPMC